MFRQKFRKNLYDRSIFYRSIYDLFKHPIFTAQKIIFKIREGLLKILQVLALGAAYLLKPLMIKRRSNHFAVLHFSVISHKPYMVTRLLREKGIKADYYATNTDMSYLRADRKGYDYGLPSTRKGLARLWTLYRDLFFIFSRYDIIHIHFNTLLFSDGFEQKFLRVLDKKIIFHFRGCDLRQRTRNNELFPDLNVCQKCDYPKDSCESEAQRLRYQIAKEYGHHFFATTPDLACLWPGAEWLPFVPPVGVGLEEIKCSREEGDLFRVVTSSNHDGLDGTAYIRDAVQRLRDEGEAIGLIEVKGIPYKEALAIYKGADVYVGKLRLGYYNNSNIETLLMGVPNMSFIRNEFVPLAGEDCPIINTTPETVYENLKYYLHHRDELRAIGLRGPQYIHKHHDTEKIIARLLRCYEELLKNGKVSQRTEVEAVDEIIQSIMSRSKEKKGSINKEQLSC